MPRNSVIQILVNCPHCQLPIQIMSNEINCAIFRHGTFKVNGKQMDPHTLKIYAIDMQKTVKFMGVVNHLKLV